MENCRYEQHHDLVIYIPFPVNKVQRPKSWSWFMIYVDGVWVFLTLEWWIFNSSRACEWQGQANWISNGGGWFGIHRDRAGTKVDSDFHQFRFRIISFCFNKPWQFYSLGNILGRFISTRTFINPYNNYATDIVYNSSSWGVWRCLNSSKNYAEYNVFCNVMFVCVNKK